jgi:hypothetical protein
MTSYGDDPRPEDPISPGEALDVARGRRPGRFRRPTNRLGCSVLIVLLLVASSVVGFPLR